MNEVGESVQHLATYDLDHLSEVSPYRPSPRRTVEQVDFTRIEDKFLVKAERLPELIEVIKSHLSPFYPIPGTHYTLVRSLYFDSNDLEIFRNHFSHNERFKLRVRQYGPNGQWQKDDYLLERKSKRDSVTKKFRFQIGAQDFNTICNGEPIVPSQELRLHNINMGSKKLIRRLEKVNKDIQRHQLKPQVAVTYKRLSFEQEDLRMTVDDQLRFENKQPVPRALAESLLKQAYWPRVENMRYNFLKEKCVILEVKHSGHIPQWILDFLKEARCSEPVSFSKYCFAVSDHLDQRRR